MIPVHSFAPATCAWHAPRAATSLLLVLLLGGCAAMGLNPIKQSADQAAEAPQTENLETQPAETGNVETVNVETQAPEVVESPTIDLDQELVYDYLLADIAARRGRPDVSLEATVRVAERTRNPSLILRAFRAAMRSGEPNDALAMADLMEEVGDDPTRVAFARVQALLLTGREAEVVDTISALLIARPNDRERIFNNAGEVFAQQPEPGQYIDAMRTLTDLYPDDRHGYFALAYLSNRARDLDALGYATTRALELDPEWEQAAIVRYVQLVQSEDVDAARSFAEEFLKQNPDALTLAERHARLLAASGEMSLAATHFERILKRKPDNSDIIIATALVRMQLEQWSDARRLLLRHLELNPVNDETRMHLGRLAISRERFDEAIDWFAQVTDDTMVFEAQRRIASALKETDSLDAALEHLYQLVPSTIDEEVEILLTQEQFLREGKRIDEAHQLIDGAVREIPDNSDLLYSRGLLAAELKMIDQHEKDIRRVIEMEPDNAHAYNALGYTLADQTDRYEEALELISRALELAPDDPFILDSMGWVQYRLGRMEAAEQYLRQALAIREDAEIAAHLGEVLWQLGTRDEAIALWDKALKNDPDNRTLLDTLERLDPR